MKRKIGYLVFFLVILGILLVGCNTRDLSSPSSRIIGHWRSKSVDYYFQPINKDTLIGNLIIVNDGISYFSRWKLISEERGGELIGIQFFDPLIYNIEYIIPKNGLEIRTPNGSANLYPILFTFVDNKSKP